KYSACACFGGWFVPFFLKNPGGKMSEICQSVYRRTGWHSNKILQWDSWRLWESWGAGCTTFHLDFDKYGIQMPVMPENWRHYIGIDLNNVEQAINRIRKEPEILEYVATEGRKWAMEHYSPIVTAQRFLKILGEEILIPQLKRI
ncbi:MAG: glycosyltransferase, partial [Waterburya sp.]